MKTILHNIKEFLLANKTHFIAFIVPPLFFLAAYATVGIFPFGEKSVLAVDFSSQYVYFFDYLRSVFLGQESLFYNWSGSPSGGFYGTFAYYLASPFDLIVLLFPRENITEGLLTMLLAKTACAGLTMSVFLKKHRKYSEFTSVLFSLIYAMCGYAAANTINPMWLDAVVALPLITMGIERICRKQGFLLYTVTLFLAIVANYYTGYMLCVFSGIYFIYFILSRTMPARKHKIEVFALSSTSAVMMSGIIIIPSVLSLLSGKLDGGFDRIEFRECFNIMDGFLKFFPTVYDSQRYNGLPFIYCGLFVLIFAIAYFICGKFSLRERISNGIVCGFLMFSMYFKPLDNLWHGGRAPVWFEHRFSFILIFMLIIIAARTFENIKLIRQKHIGAAFLVLLGLFLIANGFKTREYKHAEYIALISLVFLAIAGGLALLIKYKQKNVVKGAVIMLVCIELFTNMQSYITDIDNDFGYQKRDEYAPFMSELKDYADKIKENDSGFYRVEKTFHRAFNDNIGAGIYGVSFSSSVYNSDVLKLMKKMGFGQYDWHTRYNGSTMFTDDIFGIKYIISKDGALVPYNENDGIVYENPDALPVAFLADKAIINSEIEDGDPFMLQQSLASILTGEYEEIFARISDAEYSSKNITRRGDHLTKTDFHSDGIVMYSFNTPKSGAVYAYFPTDREYTCALYVNGKYLRNYFNGFDLNTAFLGNFSEGERISVEIKLYTNEAEFREPVFCVCDSAALEAFNAKIPHNEVKKTDSCTLEVTVNAEEESALFTTIPYEKGWSAYVDGKKSEVQTAVNGAFMCIKVPEGEHTVKLVYLPEGFQVGIIISLCGAALLAGMIVVRARRRKKKARG